jgi:hypothetical protein
MKKILLMFLLTAVPAAHCGADMAFYLNGGVSNVNPTIGLDAEFQYGYASVLLGAGVMSYNDFGFGTGIRGYLFGLDGGPYLECLYGTTYEDVVKHTDSNGKEVIDSITVYRGFSALAGWRSFFADGWNMTFGAGAAEANGKFGFVYNVTAGMMLWGDEAAVKNADKYGKSYEPPEPEVEGEVKELPEPGPEEEILYGADGVEMQAAEEGTWVTPAADTGAEPAVAVTPSPEPTVSNTAPPGLRGGAPPAAK